MTAGGLAGKKVLALVSGGLDSTVIVHWLSQAGVRVTALTLDLGQPDEDDLESIPARMKAAGASDALLVDGKERLAEYMLQTIRGQAWHEGMYWNTTGIARMASVAAALPAVRDLGIDVVTHGATGRGNDQVRFELALAALAPEARVYAPWRDNAFVDALGGRSLMIDYCEAHGLQISATREKPYSTDANFCGLTHEAGKLESLQTSTDFVSFVMGNSPMDAPDQKERVSVAFEMGTPVKVNGAATGLVQAYEALNEIAGRNGVGIGLDAVENRRIGIKSRGVYEAPGVTFLGWAYGKLLQLILDRNSRKFFDVVSRQLSDVIYEGEWFTPHAAALLGVTESVARYATGEIEADLYKGNIRFAAANDAPHSLYDEEGSSMEKIGELSHEWAQGYMELANFGARAASHSGQTRKP